jgi:hypothetical protein
MTARKCLLSLAKPAESDPSLSLITVVRLREAE